MDGPDIAPLPGLVDARLELEDAPLDVSPADRLPFIPRRRRRAHDLCTPTCSSTVHTTVPTSASPPAFPRALASSAIPPSPRLWLSPALVIDHPRERGVGYFVPHVRLALP